MTNTDLPESLLASAASQHAIDLVADAAELSLDAVLDEGLLRDIPIAGSLVKAAHLVGSVKERLFLKKIYMFMKGTADISPEERSDFAQRIARNGKTLRDVGEKVLLLLERHDDFHRSLVTGKLFAAFIAGRLPWADFEDLSSAVDRLRIIHLRSFVTCYGFWTAGFDEEFWIDCHYSGLADRKFTIEGPLTFVSRGDAGKAVHSFESNRLGNLLKSILRDPPNDWPQDKG